MSGVSGATRGPDPSPPAADGESEPRPHEDEERAPEQEPAAPAKVVVPRWVQLVLLPLALLALWALARAAGKVLLIFVVASVIALILNPAVAFQCPADSDIFRLVGSSYDWRDTGPFPETTIAGKLAASNMRQNTVMAYDQLFGWHGKHVINVVRLDGSALPMSDDDFAKDLQQPVAFGQ